MGNQLMQAAAPQVVVSAETPLAFNAANDTSALEQTMAKQINFQQESFQHQLERQLVVQNELRQRQMSMEVAKMREIFKYSSTFYACVIGGGVLGTAMKKNPMFLVPSVPMGFVCAYQYDAAYGDMSYRMKEEAERIMSKEVCRIASPSGMPTFDMIEAKRKEFCLETAALADAAQMDAVASESCDADNNKKDDNAAALCPKKTN